MNQDGSRGSTRVARRWFLAVAVVLTASAASPTHAQVPSRDRTCIATFNKGMRDVARAQGKVVSSCLKAFAKGALVVSPESCVLADAGGRVGKATAALQKKLTAACAGAAPTFGMTSPASSMARAALGEVGLVHATIGPDIDGELIPEAVPASCQANVTDALLRCVDARRLAFSKCVKSGLASGQVTDAASLEATCLGSGAGSQPDANHKIARSCAARIPQVIAGRCRTVDLADAFPACGTGDAAALAGCLDAQAACQACLLLNEVDGLSRDCDAFDDANASNGTCGPECADGVLQKEEACDDGGIAAGDGCAADCTVEQGWSCSGSPSTCSPNCGNGTIDGEESCDDGDATGGDGCSATCTIEPGFGCTGDPSVCTPTCGNGAIQASLGEGCDDGDGAAGDGCSATCRVEEGWRCTGQPSVCTFVCGNGTFEPGESCDDGDASAGDGCSATCRIEPGWLCVGQPSVCAPTCGDGLVRGGETCDDGNASGGDGCSFFCHAEAGFTCSAEPSNCIAVCGDGFVRGAETCDDGNTTAGDGCSAPFCLLEPGANCVGQPSTCAPTCGNGLLDLLEECDDGDAVGGDGCSATCRAEPGFACGGQPSSCVLSCGNGAVQGAETCDDGNAVAGDGCSASCRNESGWLCANAGLPCARYQVTIDTPVHGAFTTAGTAVVTGRYTALPPGQASVLINGVPADSLNPFTRTFSHTVTLDPVAIFNPVRATLTNLANGDDVHDRRVIVAGESTPDGGFSLDSVAMRLNDSALDTLEPVVGVLASSQLDLATLLPSGTVLADECFLQVIGCWGRAKVKIGKPSPTYTDLSLALDAKPGVVGADITITGLRVDVDIDGSGLVPDCGIRITAQSMPLAGDFALEPNAEDPSYIDVNQVGPTDVGFVGFRHEFTYGLCGAPIIGDIIQSLLPDIEEFATGGISGFLGDPDGGGPNDSPIADAVEATLSGVALAGQIGSGLNLAFDAPLFQVAEDENGLTLGADARFRVSVGSGPGQCMPPAGAPDLTASYAPSVPFPPFGPTTPVAHVPYGVGIGISPAGFNQLLRGQTECGLMRTSLTTIDLDGAGGTPPLPIDSTLLSLIAPEFAQLPAGTPLRIDVAPTLAPVVTDTAGPNGELTELRIAHVRIDIVQPGPETLWLRGAFDARLGMDLSFLPDGSGLGVTLGEPRIEDTAMAVVVNPLGADETQLETILPTLIRPMIPSLAGALSGFPVPSFFGLQLSGVEVSLNGAFGSLYANLTPAP